jgi:hypothetical protein
MHSCRSPEKRSWCGTCQLTASRTPGLILHLNSRQERRNSTKEPFSKKRTTAFHALSLSLSESAAQKNIQHISACTPANRTCTRLLRDRICASDPAYAEIRCATQTLRLHEKRLWRRKLGVHLNTSELTGSLTESFTAHRLLQEHQLSESTTRSYPQKMK